MEILGISGSLNRDSSNTRLLRDVRRLAGGEHDVTVLELLDALPHFSPDRDREPALASVAELRRAVRDADAVVFATPEYAGGMPGVLKNALDWLVGSGELYDKPTVVVSAAPSVERGQRARASVELTLRMQGAHVCDSFTVAVAKDQSAEQRTTQAGAVYERMVDALVNRPCTAVGTER
ncbi:MAG TPA: NAD(P)H-dependent oxidoreductase [Acidimicrobiia bacterium]|jgi:NAD(P)H-dependent FMN reductase